MSKKRVLDSFFKPSSQKKARVATPEPEPSTSDIPSTESSHHPIYPYSVPYLPTQIIEQLAEVPASEGKEINDQPDLDLLYFQPYIPKTVQEDLFEFLRRELFFYRVRYTIKRYGTDTQINTPRYTTVSRTICRAETMNPRDARTASKVLTFIGLWCRHFFGIYFHRNSHR